MATIDQSVLSVLDQAEKDGPLVRLVGQLDRKLYTAVNKVLEAAGGQWVKKLKAHSFPGDAAAALEPLILSGEYAPATGAGSTQQELGQFDTPKVIVDLVMQLAEIQPDMKVLEPSAGLGNIVEGVIKALGSAADVFAYEIDPVRHEHCRSRHYNAFGAGGLARADFLVADPLPVFDRVVMNPPFAKGADIAHVRHAYDFLKPRGRLVAVMSPGWRFRQDRKFVEFLQWVESVDGVWKALPEGSFKESGTLVNTGILVVNKPL